MELDLVELLRACRLRIDGVVHVGAHIGDEVDDYRHCGITRQVWIEPQPEVFARLQARIAGNPDARAFNVACGASAGEAEMHLLNGNDGRSNSLLVPKLHLERFPDFRPAGTIRVPVVPLDDLLAREGLDPRAYPLMVLDVQGFEMHVLRGAGAYLASGCKAVVSEVAAAELYAGGCLVQDLDSFFGARGFLRLRTKWAAGCAGDAFYIRAELLPTLTRWRLRTVGGKGHRPPTRGFGLPRR